MTIAKNRAMCLNSHLAMVSTLCNVKPHFWPLYVSLGKKQPSWVFIYVLRIELKLRLFTFRLEFE